MQPVKIVDPHLASTFFDGYKRVYLHSTIELVNKSAGVAECSLNIQVSTELEENTFLIEHLETQHLSISPDANIHYTFPQVSFLFLSLSLSFSFTFFFSFASVKKCTLGLTQS